jgi:sulfite dehydrogenase
LSRKVWIPTALVIALFGVAIPAMVIGDNTADTGGGGGGASAAAEGGSDEAAGGGGGEAAAGGGETAAAAGKETFTQSCGTCHVLSDAGTQGKVGPPLDDLKPDEARVLAAIQKGGAGSGSMPANIVTGKEAEEVAAYVASVAGQ